MGMVAIDVWRAVGRRNLFRGPPRLCYVAASKHLSDAGAPAWLECKSFMSLVRDMPHLQPDSGFGLWQEVVIEFHRMGSSAGRYRRPGSVKIAEAAAF